MKLAPQPFLGSFILVDLDYLKVSNTPYLLNSGLIMHLRQVFYWRYWIKENVYSDSIEKIFTLFDTSIFFFLPEAQRILQLVCQ